VPASDEQIARDTEADWIAFSSLTRMTSHWNRPGWWPGRGAYYWYLTFAGESGLHEIAARCQEEVHSPYFDLVPLHDLHMTIERIAFNDEMDESELERVASAARIACRELSPFAIRVGPLAGSQGAISFSASPHSALAMLRNTLDTATRTVLATVGPTNPRFRPHVGIAYCNSNILAESAISTVGRLRNLPIVEATVRSASLVSLTREQNSYRWLEKYRIPLGRE
jgi:2'-5' RNA ligase